uniref:Uncharacterized protein n=1 Tax=Candidatus Kentrum eta TaxID=2126337 RepID=A0A450VIF3_9GAMM|nr:MAG: hypothetical protein BECKH772A_GA0070896_101755 [Candidatus Kentron sp. H]VFJ99954.1 MAG: hypothetical protein BECKH772B_GA0070898_101745 [Candidatus Kentron sp. H]VFK04505.1 MAG: hypothetical protein BECKH772B_GA0070898_104522 [Candidatus Kentron sp. H]VFK04530.1 MAG: hypothetical protein BECKH772C_GA0070978_101875 [Candidatus Kentron sp. H]
MPSLPEAIVTFLSVFAPLFSSPVWNHVQVLLIGAILCQGPRTVTGRLRVMGLGEEKSFCNYHRVPDRAKWSSIQGSQDTFGAIGWVCADSRRSIGHCGGRDDRTSQR